MYVAVHMYACMCMCVCVCMYASMHMYARTVMHASVCTHELHIYECINTATYICAHIYVLLCMYV